MLTTRTSSNAHHFAFIFRRNIPKDFRFIRFANRFVVLKEHLCASAVPKFQSNFCSVLLLLNPIGSK